MDCTKREDWTRGHRVLHDLGFFGHYLHMNVGGRSGKQHVLAKLHKSGGTLTQRELQERSSISSAALSEVLAKLEAEGLIERSRSEEDRRQMVIKLTEAGTERALQMRARFEAFEEECMTCLSDEEQELLVDMLDRLEDHWKSLDWKEERA